VAQPAVASDHSDASQAGRPRFTERLSVAWWMWPAALTVAAIAAAEVYLGAPGLRTWVPYAVLIPATAAGLWRLGRIRVTVADGQLQVDDARLPTRFIAEVTPLDSSARRDLLGPYAQRHAFVVQRPWIGSAVQVHLNDPADATPYWVVSSRRPAALADALLAERDASTTPR
jgi:hypothetical protein